eukprot:CAMPEP_0184754836 /NCGR_PEP_ID=MMETSP0315-20130426/44836_1 /TAXON_ID=101924 /ORGANISM="Rhodosorus marinus, Strain UTEX LB 2760" /LENGTH=43 /DNA_ID= /DNA_START= /DNA_END= /DNA_ORIENTATION=
MGHHEDVTTRSELFSSCYVQMAAKKTGSYAPKVQRLELNRPFR